MRGVTVLYDPLIRVLHHSKPIQQYNKKEAFSIQMISAYTAVSRNVFVNLPKEVLMSRKPTLCYEKTFMQRYTCTNQPFFV